MLVFPGVAVQTCLEPREQQIAEDRQAAAEQSVVAEEGGAFGQQIGERGGNEHTGGKRHDRVEAVLETQDRPAT